MIHAIYIILFIFLVFSLFYNARSAIENLISTIKSSKENFRESISIIKASANLKVAWHKFIITAKRYMKSDNMNKYYFCISIFLLILLGELVTDIFWEYIILLVIVLIWIRIIYNILDYQDNEIKILNIFLILYIGFVLLVSCVLALLDVDYFNNTLFAISMFVNFISLILAIKLILNTEMKPFVYDLALLGLLFYAGLTITLSYFLIGWGSIYYELNIGNKDPNNYAFNVKAKDNDTYTQMLALIYNGFTSLQSFDALEVINAKDAAANTEKITKDAIVFRIISVFFTFLYISSITAFFINLFTQGKKK